ncbi:M24 family metallopeptidase [Phosphitispora sp. TUW77]|uniref:M24 family metallopeptidase n=1 Tax=Phosphitispora sp. TUW77 TaxID=3152361 RepID=UPI003AB4F035
MNQRIEAVRKIIKENRLDGLFITKQQNWQYLSGFTGTNAILLFTPFDNYFITDFRYLEQAHLETEGFHIVEPRTLVEDTLVDQVNGLGLTRVGFEGDNLTYTQYVDYKEKTPGVELVSLNQAVEKIRQVKDDREITALRKAVSIADMAFDYILNFIRPGVSESEIALEIEHFMKKQGAQKSAFDIIVASGRRAALPHGVATDKELAAGELVILDFGAVFAGYHSDMTRTVVIGKPDPDQKRIYDIVLTAQKRALDTLKPGIRCSDTDRAARDFIRAKGYGANFGHGLGHSVGLEIHEKPALAPKDDTVLQPGMTITVEPGIYLSNWGGVRIEDLVLVTGSGCEVLSASPKELLVL